MIVLPVYRIRTLSLALRRRLVSSVENVTEGLLSRFNATWTQTTTSQNLSAITLFLSCLSLSAFNMRTLSRLVIVGFSLFSVSQAARFGTPDGLSEMAYTRAHSLGTNYKFHERDGWETINISTSLSRRSELSSLSPSNSSLPLPEAGTPSLASKRTKKPSLADTLVHTINSAWNGLRGSGHSEQVKITWYTGQDLENPSCWAEPTWAPTVRAQTAVNTTD